MSVAKKILYVLHAAYPFEVRTGKFVDALAKSGYEIIVLSRAGSYSKPVEKIGKLTIQRIGIGKHNFYSYPVSQNPVWKNAIRNAINEHKPSLIIAREITLAEVAGKAAKKANIPIIMDMAENYPAAMKLWKKYRDNPFLKFMVHTMDWPEKTERNSVSLMDGIITVCHEQHQRLNREYNFELKKMTVVHNTPHLEYFAGVKKMPNHAKIFSHHGFTTDDKKVDNLIKGFNLAAEKDKNIRLVLAGEGESFSEIRKIWENLSHKKQINLMGTYEYNDLPSILESVDIGVIPYRVNDFNNYTIHNKVFDYMACGRPLIVTPQLPAKRVIEECNCGIVTKDDSAQSIAEAIIRIKNEPIEEFSLNSLTAVRKKYNWEIDSNNLIEFTKLYI